MNNSALNVKVNPNVELNNHTIELNAKAPISKYFYAYRRPIAFCFYFFFRTVLSTFSLSIFLTQKNQS